MKRPFVIDVEASGLHPQSFPISVAWGDAVDAIEYHVIRPEPTWFADGYGWSVEAEQIHGFSFEQVQDQGEPAATVAKRLVELLGETLVYSDAPAWDRMWLDRLHADTGIERSYVFEDFSLLLPKIYSPTMNGAAYEALRAQAFRLSGARAHTADGDVQALLTMLAIAGR